MHLLSFEQQGSPHLGVACLPPNLDGSTLPAQRDIGVVDISARAPELGGLLEVLQNDALSRVATVAEAAPPDFCIDELQLLPPVPDAGKIVCIGVNYRDRNAEYRDGSAPPKYPSVFLRTQESLVGHRRPLLRPPESEQLDYEGEFAVVIGRAGRRIPAARAHEFIAGMTLLNEGSIRDWLRHSKFNVTQGKNFEHSGSCGPWLVTNEHFCDAAGADSYDQLQIVTRVNGEVRQKDTTANLMFSFRYLIEYLSTFMRLQPGDVISTGTPNGAGARFDPPRYLQPGDRVEVESPAIGVLCNVVEDEARDASA